MLKYYQRLSKWQKIYEKSLDYLELDFKFLAKKENHLTFAIDFHDIYHYAFPYLNVKSIETFKKFTHRDNPIVRKHLARTYIFFNMKFDLLLLPSYLDELNYKLGNLKQITELNQFKSLKRHLMYDESLKKISDYITDDSVLQEKRLYNLIKKYKEILFILMSYQDGVKELSSLINDNQSKLNYLTQQKNKYFQEIYELNIGDFDKIFDDINEIRPTKPFENYKDAEAIKYINKMNSRYQNRNFLLISEAKSIVTYFNDYASSKNQYHRSLLYFIIFLRLSSSIKDMSKKDFSKVLIENIKVERDAIKINEITQQKLNIAEILCEYDRKLNYNTCSIRNDCEINGLCKSLKNDFKKYQNKIDEIENAEFIMKKIGNTDFYKSKIDKYYKDNNIKEKLLEIVTNLKNDAYIEKIRKKSQELKYEKHKSFLKFIVKISVAKNVDSDSITLFKYFPVYIKFKSPVFVRFQKLMQNINEGNNFNKLNNELTRVIDHANKREEFIKFESYLLFLTILFVYKDYKLIQNFFVGMEDEIKTSAFYEEFCYIYVTSIWLYLESFEVNNHSQTNIVNQTKLANKTINEITRSKPNDERFTFIKLLLILSIYESDILISRLKSIFGRNVDITYILKEYEKLINSSSIDKYFLDPLINNKCYFLALTGDINNISESLSQFEQHFGISASNLDKVKTLPFPFIDTYAYIHYQVGLQNNSKVKRNKYFVIAKKLFVYVLDNLPNNLKRLKQNIEQSIIDIDKSLKNIN